MADNKGNKFKKKPFQKKERDDKGGKFNKKQKPDKKPSPDKKPEVKGEKKPENKGDFKCKNCGGQLVRRWIFPNESEAEPYTKLVCESCGTGTKPREIKYGENGFIWGCKTPREDKEQRKAG